MAKKAIAVGAMVIFGLLSLWVGSEMPESGPGTLKLDRVNVGPRSHFSASNDPTDIQVARISFTFDRDLRARARKGGLFGISTILKPCRCFEAKTSNNDHFCREFSGGVDYDASGYINSYNPNILTSKDGPSPFHYYLLVPTKQEIGGEPPYDLIAQPEDLCLQIVSGTLWGDAKTDVIRIPKQQILAAEGAARKAAATGDIMRKLGIKPLVEPLPYDDSWPIPANPLANPLSTPTDGHSPKP